MTKTDPYVALIRPAECANGRLKARVKSGTIDVEIEPDPGTGTRQWFHFGVDAPAGTRIRIVNAGAATYPRGWADRLVWSRSPDRTWHCVQTEWKDGIVEFAHDRAGGPAAYALFPPYPLRRLDLLLKRARAHADADVVEADAASHEAPRISLGARDPEARQIWIVAAQHGGEHPAIWFADGFVDALLRRATLPAGIRFHVVPIANPQGMKAGHLRTNISGQDPNRHWDRPSACREVGSLLAAMAATGVDVLLDVHNDCEMRCVYLDVLDEWMKTPPRLVAIRELFERRLAERSPDVAFGKRYPWQAPPDPDLLAGMCAPAIEHRFGAAAVTLELPIGRYRNAAGAEHVWTPKHSFALGHIAASILMEIDPSLMMR